VGPVAPTGSGEEDRYMREIEAAVRSIVKEMGNPFITSERFKDLMSRALVLMDALK
jgi:hypothetical protein